MQKKRVKIVVCIVALVVEKELNIFLLVVNNNTGATQGQFVYLFN
jgi:hypothetical protein